MNKLSGGSLILAAIFLVIIGAILRSGVIAWLIDLLGILLIILGVILGIIGIFNLVSGTRKSRRY